MKLSYRLIYPEKVHSALSALILFLAIASLFAFSNLTVMTVVFALTIGYFIYLGMKLFRFLKISFYAASFTVIYLAMVLLFPNPGKAFDISVFVRLFFISTLSVSSLEVLHGEVILLYLAQKKKFPVMLIYPLLFSLSSINLFKQKFELYRLNHQMRQTKGWVLPKMLFQFLVFTLRFSESGALSLIARGLSENKFYYYDFSIKNCKSQDFRA